MLVIHISPYDATWPITFLRIQSELLLALHDIPIISIEHIGSTSIPGLAAKPIIALYLELIYRGDIDIIVPLPSLMPSITALAHANYVFNPEPPEYDRLSFYWQGHIHDSGASHPTEDGQHRRAVYLNVPGGVALADHLAVRDVLRTDQALREEYAEVKWNLSLGEFESIGAYGAAKGAILRKILQRSRIGKDELREVGVMNRWK